MKNERGKLVLGALGLLAGLLLIGCALVLGDRLPGPGVGLMCGCGGALGGMGGSALLTPLLMRSLTPEQRKEMERGERDERNVAIREKAAYASWYWTLYLLWGAFFVTLFLGSGFPTALVSVVIVLHSVFLMVNMSRWAKRM